LPYLKVPWSLFHVLFVFKPDLYRWHWWNFDLSAIFHLQIKHNWAVTWIAVTHFNDILHKKKAGWKCQRLTFLLLSYRLLNIEYNPKSKTLNTDVNNPVYRSNKMASDPYSSFTLSPKHSTGELSLVIVITRHWSYYPTQVTLPINFSYFIYGSSWLTLTIVQML